MPYDYREMLQFDASSHAPYWCARAIYSPGELPDLVPNRQGFGGASQHGIGELRSKLNAGVLATFLAKVRDSREPPMGLGTVEHRERGVVIRGTPNSSDGYLYVAATVE